jgi:hypothetical protein
MTTQDDEQSQSGYEEGLAGGPGAPTPLHQLEVCADARDECDNVLM